VIEDPNLTEEEKVAREVFLTEQMMVGGDLALTGINVADRVARTTNQVQFDTFYSVNGFG